MVGPLEAPATRKLALRARHELAPEEAVVVVTPGERPDGLDPAWLEGRGTIDGQPAAYICRGTECQISKPGDDL